MRRLAAIIVEKRAVILSLIIAATLCFAYLDRSRRVHATYGAQPTDA